MAESLGEQDLRRAKDSLRKAVSDQQRAIGVPAPGGREVDEFIDPILRKVEIDHELAQQRRPPEQTEPYQGPGEVIGDEPMESDGVVSQTIGIYDWHLKTDEVTPWTGSYVPSVTDRLRAVIQRLMRLPDWRAQFNALWKLCGRHPLRPQKHCVECERRDEKFQAMLLKAYQKYGHPHHQRNPKIVVG